ncbi:hypothetical protein [Actinotalea sp. JY-7876]|uniref:hypothetical protein n=1 Tax=Actinotalea sp. JY-7876 TaxID=2758442 RepID=UPI0015F71E66|nr:hypothetical protein [Actinotalea sp. JY-7876]
MARNLTPAEAADLAAATANVTRLITALEAARTARAVALAELRDQGVPAQHIADAAGLPTTTSDRQITAGRRALLAA